MALTFGAPVSGIALRIKSRGGRIAALVAIVVGSSVLVASPASAHNQNGHLLVRGTGSTYAMSYPSTSCCGSPGSIAAIAVPAGGSATYSFKVLNKGTASSQYRVLMSSEATATVRSGTAYGPVVRMGPYDDIYLTPSIAPGATLTYFVKVQLAAKSPQDTYDTGILLFRADPNSSVPELAMDTIDMKTEVRAPTVGTSETEIFTRNGGLSYVGGSVDGQTAGAAPMKQAASTTFTVRLRNNSSTPLNIGVSFGNDAGCDDGFAVSIKSGTTDVTAAWMNHTFRAPRMTKGQTKDYTITIKRSGSDEFCKQTPRFYVWSNVRVYLGVAPAV